MARTARAGQPGRGDGAAEVTIDISAIPPLVRHVRSLDGDLYLCREVADALDLSPSTVRRFGARDPDRLGPSHETYFGRVLVYLYDAATVERLHAHLAEHRSASGQPRLWSDAERRTRRAAHNRAAYRRRRAVVLEERG